MEGYINEINNISLWLLKTALNKTCKGKATFRIDAPKDYLTLRDNLIDKNIYEEKNI